MAERNGYWWPNTFPLFCRWQPRKFGISLGTYLAAVAPRIVPYVLQLGVGQHLIVVALKFMPRCASHIPQSDTR